MGTRVRLLCACVLLVVGSCVAVLSAGQVYLEVYGTGIRNAKNVTLTIGGVNVPVYSSGSQGIDPGLDQINVGPLPQTLTGRGQVNVVVTADGQAANTTNIVIN